MTEMTAVEKAQAWLEGCQAAVERMRQAFLNAKEAESAAEQALLQARIDADRELPQCDYASGNSLSRAAILRQHCDGTIDVREIGTIHPMVDFVWRAERQRWEHRYNPGMRLEGVPEKYRIKAEEWEIRLKGAKR
jgi:hypothetical protein